MACLGKITDSGLIVIAEVLVLSKRFGEEYLNLMEVAATHDPKIGTRIHKAMMYLRENSGFMNKVQPTPSQRRAST